MKTATISELKAKLSDYVETASDGEEVIVTKRGRPVARLSPLGGAVADDERVQRLVARGVLRPPTRKLKEVLKDLRRYRVSEGAVVRVLREDRDEGG